jgi:hypothetical protein
MKFCCIFCLYIELNKKNDNRKADSETRVNDPSILSKISVVFYSAVRKEPSVIYPFNPLKPKLV